MACDEASLAAAMAAVEAACAAFSSPALPPAARAAAEAQLLAFRAAPHALHACRYILERSASQDAAFQARAPRGWRDPRCVVAFLRTNADAIPTRRENPSSAHVVMVHLRLPRRCAWLWCATGRG
jgi:hypothetical protein